MTTLLKKPVVDNNSINGKEIVTLTVILNNGDALEVYISVDDIGSFVSNGLQSDINDIQNNVAVQFSPEDPNSIITPALGNIVKNKGGFLGSANVINLSPLEGVNRFGYDGFNQPISASANSILYDGDVLYAFTGLPSPEPYEIVMIYKEDVTEELIAQLFTIDSAVLDENDDTVVTFNENFLTTPILASIRFTYVDDNNVPFVALGNAINSIGHGNLSVGNSIMFGNNNISEHGLVIIGNNNSVRGLVLVIGNNNRGNADFSFLLGKDLLSTGASTVIGEDSDYSGEGGGFIGPYTFQYEDFNAIRILNAAGNFNFISGIWWHFGSPTQNVSGIWLRDYDATLSIDGSDIIFTLKVEELLAGNLNNYVMDVIGGGDVGAGRGIVLGNRSAGLSGAAVIGDGLVGSGVGTHVTGHGNIALKKWSSARGIGAYAINEGQHAIACNKFTKLGDNQNSHYILRQITLDDTPLVLLINGTNDGFAAGGISLPAVKLNSLNYLNATIIAKSQDDINSSWRLEGVIKRGAGAASIMGSVTKTVIQKDTPSANSWDVSLTLINSIPNINITGAFNKTIRWNGYLRWQEVSF